MNNDHGLFSLNDKVIIVTGGTGRYGYPFCEALSQAGGTVILTSRDKERAKKAAGTLRDKGLSVHGYSLDLAREDSINEFVPPFDDIFVKIMEDEAAQEEAAA